MFIRLLGILAVLGTFFYVTDMYPGNTVERHSGQEFEWNGQTTKIEQAISEKEYLFNFRESLDKAIAQRVDKADFIQAEALPLLVKKSFVATEDKRFYEHGALDFFGIGRAVYTNILSGETMEGGSTITQQTAKNLFLSSEQSFSRKFEEMLIAYLLEYHYTKDEILAIYINTIYYGNDYYGIKEAAQGYFDKRVGELNLAQIAVLAGLPQAPTYYNPYNNFEAMKGRQYTVLSLLTAQDIISVAELNKAYTMELGLRK